MILLYANHHHILTADLNTNFRQESNFFYHTQIFVPGCRAILVGEKKMIFLPDKDEKKIVREGESVSRDEVQSNNPNAELYPLSSWTDVLVDLYDGSSSIQSNLSLINHPAQQEKKEIKELLGISEKDIITLDQAFRAIKSLEEIQTIEKAQKITIEAIEYATQNLKPGMREYEIAAKLSYYYATQGYTDAFPPIVASGKNACTLHYIANNSQIKAGELLLIDTGAYIDGYCGDCSRTIAIGRHPTSKVTGIQKKEIKNDYLKIVKQVHDTCINYVKPGITMKHLHSYAVKQFELEFDRVGITWKREYFPHSIGHSIGLDVHDPLSKDHPLEVGMCITIEPGLYIPESSIGIRRENIIKITKDGCNVLQ